MTAQAAHWEQLLEYRRQAAAWRERSLGLAATRLRVAKLLESAFGFGLDDVDADFSCNGATADFVLRVENKPWGSVLVRAMAEGIEAVPPAEAFVIADAAGLPWCWVTDGLSLIVYHIGPDLALARLVRCHVLDDGEADLRAAWRLLDRDSILAGELDAYRQARERPDDAAVAAALLSDPVLEALGHVLAERFPRPGAPDELAVQVRRVLQGAGPTDGADGRLLPASDQDPSLPDVAPAAASLASLEDPAPPSSAEAPPRRPTAPAGAAIPLATDAVPAAATASEPAGHEDRAPGRKRASLAALLPRRRRLNRPVESPAVTADPAEPAEAGNGHACPVPVTTERETETAPDGEADPKVPAIVRRMRAGEGLRSALARQQLAHARLRQNLQDLRENRERLQDALALLRREYPERFAAMAEEARANVEGPVAIEPAPSWSLLGHLQTLGNGYWELTSGGPLPPPGRLN